MRYFFLCLIFSFRIQNSAFKMTRPLKVFPSTGSGHRLSHAHADATRVRALHNRLIADGVDSCLDKEKLIPCQNWEREIRKA